MFWIDGQEFGVGRLFWTANSQTVFRRGIYQILEPWKVFRAVGRELMGRHGSCWDGMACSCWGKDAAAVADVRKGFERIHGWQTSGLGWKVDGWYNRWVDLLTRLLIGTPWSNMEHTFKGTARSPFCICPKTGTSFLPSCAAGVPTFLLHVISRLAGCLEQWQQSCEGGPSLSKVLQCNRPSPPKWKGVFQKNKGLAAWR